MKHRDLDAVLLLLFLCETHQHHPDALDRPHSEWRQVLNKICSDTILRITNITGGAYDGAALIPYIEMVIRCRRFVGVMGCGGKEGREIAASPEAVVALPAVEVRNGGVECVICKEDMKEGRDACKLPCQHLFHWMCILPWLKKTNTCPCCRFQLPCDDIFGEIQRLWGVLVKASGKSLDNEWT
ncbi:Zinc finger, RING-type [Corchorus olitorius]|uniref:RING-type E3 ubiquitin transferase n=1 Tax=Corchorus olitorius TaxID=93759 RepID=A0A1R3K986_9ROSI|nr:Zinc finger, RING-type [Corchorus olitorius]